MKFSRFFCLGIVFSVLCTSPSLAIDDTTKSILKTYFGNPSVSSSDVVTSDSGTVSLANANALKVDMGNDVNRGINPSNDYRTITYGRVFVMVVDAHAVDGILSGIKICPIQLDGAAIKADNGDPDKSSSDSVSGGGRQRVCRVFEKEPEGDDKSKCRWLCTNGYTGTECTVATNDFQNNYGTDDLSWDKVSVKKTNSDGSTGKAVNFGSHYYNDYSGSVNHYNLAKMFLLATKTVSNGAFIQPVAISVKVGHEVEIEKNKTVPRYKTRETQKLFCISGYKPGFDDNGNEVCKKISENPCAGSSSASISFSGYTYNGNVLCEYDAVNNKWCRKPNGGTTECATGYYGHASGVTVSDSCVWSASGCTRCDYDSVTQKYGKTDDASITNRDKQRADCYRENRTSLFEDTTGYYNESGNCYWK